MNDGAVGVVDLGVMLLCPEEVDFEWSKLHKQGFPKFLHFEQPLCQNVVNVALPRVSKIPCQVTGCDQDHVKSIP